MSEDKLLTPKEVRDILGISRMTLYRIIHTHMIVCIDLNKGLKMRPRYRIKQSSVDAYIQKQST